MLSSVDYIFYLDCLQMIDYSYKFILLITSNIRIFLNFVRKDRNLDELSKLGHFLKGSSAAIGLTKVKASCEKMQHFGNMKDETGSNVISKDDAVTKISTLLEKVKDEYKEAETYLKNFYTERDNSCKGY